LVGPSGAGKSTVASLLLRFWDPQQGCVRIGGTRLPDLTLDALYERIALVAQDTWLLNGSLEDNIRLARPDANEAALRHAIARAFLRDAPILILDEATSHLDALSEARVHQALVELMRHRTTLIIAHRLSTIRQADMIAVVDAGRVVEWGTHDELLRSGGVY